MGFVSVISSSVASLALTEHTLSAFHLPQARDLEAVHCVGVILMNATVPGSLFTPSNTI